MEDRQERKLWEPAQCCCFKLKTGSILIGFIFLFIGCLDLIVGVTPLLTTEADVKQACADTSLPEKCPESWSISDLGQTITPMIIGGFQIIFGILLLYVIFKQKTKFFIPLITVFAVQIGLLILITVGMIFTLLLYFRIHFMFILFFGGIFGLVIYLETYFLLVIRAYYYEIKRAKGDIHVALNEQNVEAPLSPGPQAAPIYPVT